jgi:hypothetical protein
MIHEKITEIRDLINEPWRHKIFMENNGNYYKLCSSLDVLGDSQHSINFYMQLKDFEGPFEGGYLYAYGILQSLYVQSDAILSLEEAIHFPKIFNKKDFFKKQYPDLLSIRELRNKSIGHPTSSWHSSFHFLNQSTLTKNGFGLLNFYSDERKPDHEYIDITKAISIQEKNVNNIFEKIIVQLNKEYQLHKNKYKKEKLVDLFPYEELHIEPKPLFEVDLQSWIESLNKIKDGLLSRKGETDREYFVLLEYLFNQLELNFINNHLSTEVEHFFIESAELYMKKLKDKCAEIDLEFNS